MRVLVSRLSALGDVVCTLPVATAIKEQWPDSVVTWMVDRRFRGIADCCSAIDQVVERPKSYRDVRSLGCFDYALDMQGLLKSGILVGLSRAHQKLGYHWQREGSFLFSRRVLPDPTSFHIVDQYLDVVRAMGAACDFANFGLAPLSGDVENVATKLDSQGWDRSPLVVINAGAGWVTKRWDPKKFAELADSLSSLGLQVAILGAPTDREVLGEVRSHGAEDVIDMVGETSVRELVALVSLAAVHVGGDTGSTHIAAALGVPAVGIYTMTRPERSCPYGQIANCFSGDPEVSDVLDRIRAILEVRHVDNN